MDIKRESYINWFTVLSYGLSEIELNQLKDHVSINIAVCDCNENFPMLIKEKTACVVINPDSLSDSQTAMLAEHYHEEKNTIILFSCEPDTKIGIPWHLVNLSSLHDSTISKAMRIIRGSFINPLQALNGETVELSGDINDGFVVIDIETDGTDRDNDQIIMLSATRINELKITEAFQTLIKVKNCISLNVESLTGITNIMVSEAPRIDEVIDKFMKFYPEDTLVVYNRYYTSDFLRASMDKLKLHYDAHRLTIDVLPLMKRLYPAFLMEHSISPMEIASLMGKKRNDSISYGEMVADLFLYLIKVLKREYGIYKLDEIKNLF